MIETDGYFHIPAMVDVVEEEEEEETRLCYAVYTVVAATQSRKM